MFSISRQGFGLNSSSQNSWQRNLRSIYETFMIFLIFFDFFDFFLDSRDFLLQCLCKLRVLVAGDSNLDKNDDNLALTNPRTLQLSIHYKSPFLISVH